MFTISEISSKTNISETTLRRYAAKYPEYLLAEKQGNITKYPPDSIDLFKLIYRSYQQKRGIEEIEKKLSERQSAVYEIQTVEDKAPQALINIIQDNTEALQRIGAALEEVADQRREIDELRKQIDKKRSWKGLLKRLKRGNKNE